MTAEKFMQPVVMVLTYHEIMEDARVLKQARALVSAGFEVHVYCAHPDGLPVAEVVDGIRIHRFECFSTERFRSHQIDALGFLKTARDAAMKRLSRLATAQEKYERLEATPTKPDKRPSRRIFRQFARLTRATKRLEFDIRRAARKRARRSLYQAEAFLFARNLARLDINLAPSIVHAHDIYTLPGALLMARRLGGRVIYDAHEIEIGRATKMPPEGNGMADAIERDCLAHVDALITVSDSCGRFYQQRFHRRPPVIVLNAPEVAPVVSESVRALAGVGDNETLIVFTGMVQRQHRGLDKVISALTELPGYHLAVLGPRHKTDDRWLETIAAQHGLSNRVHLIPPVRPEHVVGTIRDADAAICPFQDVSLNYRYAMPNKVFEAALARIPICVSDFPDMGAFVEELGIGRVMDQASPKNIAEALRDVITHRTRYVGNDRYEELIATKYNWQCQSVKLVSLYRLLLSGQADSTVAGDKSISDRVFSV